MTISRSTADRISSTLKETIIAKLAAYEPETNQMPFHTRLLGKDRYALFSFIQSMNTTFGISIWEQVAVILAEGAGRKASRQYILEGQVDSLTEGLITSLVHDLREGKAEVNKEKENDTIKQSVIKGPPRSDDSDRVVDFVMFVNNKVELYDITSAKPNMKEFVALKTKLLRWIALSYSQDKEHEVFTAIAIPYNPYFPKSYERWTMRGLFDTERNEVMVGEEFWNHVAGDKVYDELLDIFQTTGEELREQIDQKFSEFRLR
ncbi:MAG: TdeIII family type II restriction endonuclease [Thermoplasmata archaeon]